MTEREERPQDRRSTTVAVDGTAVTMAGRHADDGDLLQSYSNVLRAVRGARRGEPMGLRADDVAALALAIGADGHDIEIRIQALLGCTPAEAQIVHRELLRRRLLTPVAALAVGAAFVMVPAAAAQGDRPTLGPETDPQAQTSTSAAPTALPGTPATGATPTTLATSTTVVVSAPASGPAIEMTTTVATYGPHADPSLEVPTATPAPTAPTAPAAPVTTTIAPDIGVLPGEDPTIVIESP